MLNVNIYFWFCNRLGGKTHTDKKNKSFSFVQSEGCSINHWVHLHSDLPAKAELTNPQCSCPAQAQCHQQALQDTWGMGTEQIMSENSIVWSFEWTSAMGNSFVVGKLDNKKIGIRFNIFVQLWLVDVKCFLFQ